MFEGIVITTVALLIAVTLLSVRIIFKKNGKFHSMHISDSKAMRDQGIGCVQSQDRQARKENKNKIEVKDL